MEKAGPGNNLVVYVQANATYIYQALATLYFGT